MKKILSTITCLMLLAVVGTGWAQTNPVQTNPANSAVIQGNQEPKVLNDRTLSDRLQKDLATRNTSVGNQPVTWYDAGYGYYGTYAMDKSDYMIRYDRQGNYLETLTRRDWNDKISPATRTAFDNSAYKDQQVSAYWEVTDPGKTGSYFELNDNSGKRSRVWADDKGQFSNQPRTTGSTPRANP